MTKPNSPPSHFVLYRTGGPDRCTWQRLFERYSLQAAFDKQDELMRMGYKALVQSAEQLERIGMPYGWSAQSVDWTADETKTDHDKRGIPCKRFTSKHRLRVILLVEYSMLIRLSPTETTGRFKG